MGPDEDLPTLIQRNDHLNILRHIRVHQLRESELTVQHGTALLGKDLSRKISDELSRLAVIEQLCLASLDVGEVELAEKCLKELRVAGVTKGSTRFRRLLARCLEADGDIAEATNVYDDLLKENPANLMALKRKYCILRAQVGKEAETMEALNDYLQQNYSDIAAWYEMANYRKELGDYKGAAFALEEVLLGNPSESTIHVELAECYATIGGLDHFLLARKHMAQALELDSSNRRAQFGLVSAANSYLQEAVTGAKKSFDEHEVAVAKELVKYGCEQVLDSYKGSTMFAAVKTLMTEYSTEDSI
jgi:predicted Zn-dependent protease